MTYEMTEAQEKRLLERLGRLQRATDKRTANNARMIRLELIRAKNRAVKKRRTPSARNTSTNY